MGAVGAKRTVWDLSSMMDSQMLRSLHWCTELVCPYRDTARHNFCLTPSPAFEDEVTQDGCDPFELVPSARSRRGEYSIVIIEVRNIVWIWASEGWHIRV